MAWAEEDLARPGTAADRRTAIVRAAARCLADVGYDRVRLRDVSRASGASIGLIQHYFETRDLLLQEAFHYVSEQLIAVAEGAAAGQDPWQRIVNLVDSLARDPDLRRHCVIWTQYCVVASREPAMQRGVQRIQQAWRRHVERAVREGIASGLFDPVLDPETAIDMIVTQVDGCELAVAAGYRGSGPDRLRELVLGPAAALLGLDPARAGR